jgi:hypothetical protein
MELDYYGRILLVILVTALSLPVQEISAGDNTVVDVYELNVPQTLHQQNLKCNDK